MECNKDDAKIAMEIAEKKVTEKDYTGAKRLATKAQKMCPDLDGLNKLMVTIDVYISGEKKIGGEPNWYKILGVDCLASDVEVRKKYLKLVLMLHPDKNKFKGAEGAFNLISEAWGLLSDSDKRKLYNEKRKINGTQRTTVPTTHQPTPPSYKSEPVTVETRPKPQSSPPFVSSEPKEWFVKRRLVKRSDRSVRTTP